jgi:hypothetical protein
MQLTEPTFGSSSPAAFRRLSGVCSASPAHLACRLAALLWNKVFNSVRSTPAEILLTVLDDHVTVCKARSAKNGQNRQKYVA